MAGRSESDCVLLKRWHSSSRRYVFLPYSFKAVRASSTAFLTSATPLCTAFNLMKLPVRGGGNDVRERRFAAAGRPPEDAAAQPVQLDGAAEQAPLRDDVTLPHEFVEVVRAHLVGERLCVVFVVVEIE